MIHGAAVRAGGGMPANAEEFVGRTLDAFYAQSTLMVYFLSEGAGVVERLGPGDAPVAVGDRVAWVRGPGSYGTELVIPTQLSPFCLDPVRTSAEQTKRILVIEEGTITLGWGAEVLARLSESMGQNLHAVRRLAALDLPIPASIQLEEMILPGIDQIITMARSMV